MANQIVGPVGAVAIRASDNSFVSLTLRSTAGPVRISVSFRGRTNDESIITEYTFVADPLSRSTQSYLAAGHVPILIDRPGVDAGSRYLISATFEGSQDGNFDIDLVSPLNNDSANFPDHKLATRDGQVLNAGSSAQIAWLISLTI